MSEINRRAAISLLAATGVLASAEAAEPMPKNPDPGQLKMGYAEGPYGQIHYRSVRSANTDHPPLVCFHLTPFSGVVFDNLLREMGGDRWSLAPDTPGYGGSAPPPQPANWKDLMPSLKISDYAKAMVAFQDELGLKTVDLLGYHTGSILAMEVARAIPDRIRKIVMIGSPVFNEAEVAAKRKTFFSPVQPPIYPAYLEERLRGTAGYGTPSYGYSQIPSEDRHDEWMVEWFRAYPREHWGHNAVMFYAAEIQQNLAQMLHPVLLLNMLDDALGPITKRAAPIVLKDRRNRYVELPGWTYGSIDSHTAELAKLVRDFLA